MLPRNRGGFRRDPASDGATNGRDKDDLAEEGRSHNQSLTLTVPLGVHPRQNTADSGDASFQDTRRSSFSTPTEMLSDVQDRHYGSGANSDPHFVRTASDAEIPDGAVPTLGTAETIPKQSTTDLTVSEERQRGFDEINTGRAGGGVTGMSACGRLVCCRPGGLLYERRIRVVLFVYMLQSVRDMHARPSFSKEALIVGSVGFQSCPADATAELLLFGSVASDVADLQLFSECLADRNTSSPKEMSVNNG